MADYKPTANDMGWWLDPKDPIELTMYREEASFANMEDQMPSRFGALPIGDPNQGVLAKIKSLMEADGIGDGSLELAYFEKLAAGEIIPWKRQLIGSCVASGSMRAIVSRSLVEVLLLGHQECVLGYRETGTSNFAPFAPYHYGQGRRYAGITGYSDGSTCEGQIKGFMAKGFLPCDTPGIISDAFPEPQNSRTYRDWGARKNLVQFEPHAVKFDLLESERIRDGDHLKRKITEEFKPNMICSGWAFKFAHMHRDGFAIYTRDRGNSWAHNMTKDGIRVASDGTIWVRVRNSWGMNAHRDGDYFYVALEESDKWLKNAVCRSIGDLKLRRGPLEDFPMAA